MNTRIKTDTTSEVLEFDEVANFIKFEDKAANSAEVELISHMIKAVRVHFENRTGRSFNEKTYETFFREADAPFILPISPVISVDTVELVDHEGTKTALTLNTEYNKRGLYDIEIIPFSMSGTRDPLIGFGGYYDLLVTYKAGYGDDDTEALPYDLKQAMMRQVIQWYENRDDFRELNMLPGIDKIVQKYRKIFV